MTPLYHSATIKLTLWYLTLVMLVSLTFSGVIFAVANNELAEGLRNQSARIYLTYPVFSNDPFFKRDSDVETGARHILLNLFYVNLGVLVISGFASYWLARRTLEPIAAANEQQRQFVADASHELRTPLTALKMETEVALMDSAASKAELRAALESNLEEAGKLDSLLESLLRLSRLEAVADAQAFATTGVSTLVLAAIDRIQATAKAKQVTIQTKLDPKLYVRADSESFVQLLVILLDNAIKYSHSQSVVTVDSKHDGDRATISIKDRGIGIAPEALDHVFDRFYRADAARTSNNGYGLGLAIAKHIADAHEATLTLTSTPGKGTTASLQLPVTSPELLPPNDGAPGRHPKG